MGKLHTSQFYVLFLLTQKVEETFLCQENWSFKVERQTFPQMFLDFRFFWIWSAEKSERQRTSFNSNLNFCYFWEDNLERQFYSWIAKIRLSFGKIVIFDKEWVFNRKLSFWLENDFLTRKWLWHENDFLIRKLIFSPMMVTYYGLLFKANLENKINNDFSVWKLHNVSLRHFQPNVLNFLSGSVQTELKRGQFLVFAIGCGSSKCVVIRR